MWVLLEQEQLQVYTHRVLTHALQVNTLVE
jgi:hypothetical protein